MIWWFRKKSIAPAPKRERPIRFKLGDKVIARSNEPGPYLIGEVVVEDTFPEKTSTPFPTIRTSDGKEYTPGGIIHPYDEYKCKALDKLLWWEQWNVMATGMYFIEPEFAVEREKAQDEKLLSKDIHGI